ncbi:MAG: beta-lactamase family protein [bacterium]|nr:beta-lactamase family protein [bacterium]
MSNGESVRISGSCDPHFAGVREEFSRNFAERSEVGAAVSVYKDGSKVVDLWGGVVDPETREPWAEDTIVCMMSVGKSMAALCLLQLVDRGAVALEAPVATYWPEFAQAGKEKTTIRQILGGQAGLMYPDHAPADSIFDWDVMVEALAKQKPEWEPGTRGAYHSSTQGFLLGEVLGRVDGRRFDAFFAEEIADPLGVDFQYGLSDEDILRVTDLIPNRGSTTFKEMATPGTNLNRAWRPQPKIRGLVNSDVFRKAVFPSGNGHGNARSIARIYAALAGCGEIDGVRLLSPELIDELRKPAWEGTCDLTLRQFRYGLGFFLSSYPDPEAGMHFTPNPRSFGHLGAGGAIGFCDPEADLSFSYSPNFMCAGAGVGDRCEALVDATLRCVPGLLG